MSSVERDLYEGVKKALTEYLRQRDDRIAITSKFYKCEKQMFTCLHRLDELNPRRFNVVSLQLSISHFR